MWETLKLTPVSHSPDCYKSELIQGGSENEKPRPTGFSDLCWFVYYGVRWFAKSYPPQSVSQCWKAFPSCVGQGDADLNNLQTLE